MHVFSSIFLRLFPILVLALVVSILICSCEKEEPIPKFVEIKETFTKTSTKTVEFFSDTESHLYLSGTLKVNSGKVEITVLTPSGLIIYTHIFTVSNTQTIYSEFGTLYGTWTLKYKSLEGDGDLDLKLTN